MKHLLLILGASFGLAASLSAQTANDTPRPTARLSAAAQARQNAIIAHAARNHQAIYFVTAYTATGSHIPQVVTRYEGHDTTASSFTRGRSYGQGEIGLTGALNVGSALYALDPAISSVR